MNHHRWTTLLTLTTTFALARPAAADKLPDPPSASITSPADGAMFDAPAMIDVELDVYEGTGIDSIDLWVDGGSVEQDAEAPYGFTGVALSEGMHELLVVVNGSDGIGYPSEAVTVAVLGDGGTGSDSGGDTGSGTTGGEGSSSTSGDQGSSSGCSSATTPKDAGMLGLGLVGLIALAATRRRRE